MVTPNVEDKKIRKRRMADKASLLLFFIGVILILSLIATSLLVSQYNQVSYGSLIFLIAMIFAVLGAILKGIGRFAWPKAETFRTINRPFLLKMLVVLIIIFVLATIGLAYASFESAQLRASQNVYLQQHHSNTTDPGPGGGYEFSSFQ